MTLKELYEQTDYSKIDQLKICEVRQKPKLIGISAGMGSLRPYFDYLVIGLEPYIHYEQAMDDRGFVGDSAIKAVARLRVVIYKEEEK